MLSYDISISNYGVGALDSSQIQLVYPFILTLFYCKLFGQTFYFNYSLQGLQGYVIFTHLKTNQHIFRNFMSANNW